LPPELFIVLITGPLPLDDPPEDPLGGCPGVVESEPGVELPVTPAVDCPTDDPGMPPLDVCTPVDAPPLPPLDIDEDTLVGEVVVVGGAVYTVLTSGGRVAPAAALPGIVVVPVTCVST
jgi:hypothetical protein